MRPVATLEVGNNDTIHTYQVIENEDGFIVSCNDSGYFTLSPFVTTEEEARKWLRDFSTLWIKVESVFLVQMNLDPGKATVNLGSSLKGLLAP